MTKLEELIQKYCPNGIEYREIKEITSAINIGINPRKFFKLNPEDATGFYVTVRELNGLMGVKQHPKTDTINEEAISFIASRAKIEKGDILFSNTGTVGKMALVVDEATNWGVNEGIFIIKPIHEVIDSKFLYYYLSSKNAYNQYSKKFTGSTLKHITQEALSSLCSPVPPLEVQREIVRVLDSFTFLSAELSAELQARKKQYEYYRNELLTKNKNSQSSQLSDIAKFTYGYTDKAKDIGEARYIRITDIDDYGNLNHFDKKYIDLSNDSKRYLLHRGDLLLARTGATYGKTLYYSSDEPAVYASFLIKISLDNSKISNRFYWHFSKSQLYWRQAEKLVSKGGQQQFNANAVGKIVVPLPSLDVQEKIVTILDNFESICGDFNIGLPAEIEARQKQYEYYRDMLLTFAETGDIMPQTDR